MGVKSQFIGFRGKSLERRASSEGGEEVGIQNKLKNKVGDGKRDR